MNYTVNLLFNKTDFEMKNQNKIIDLIFFVPFILKLNKKKVHHPSETKQKKVLQLDS